MPQTRTNRRRSPRALALISAALCLACLPGCFLFAPRVHQFEPTERAYVGPPLAVVSEGDRYTVRLDAPSTGFAFEFDGRRSAVDASLVFVTVRRPDPRFMHATQIVEQQLLTPVPTSEPVRVYARVVDHDDRDAERVYSFVGASPGEPEPPQSP